MAIDGYTINGPALVNVGTGSAGALELLGYTDHGVRIRIIENYSDIITDIMGPMTPQDVQNMSFVANISCPLIAMDRTVMAKLQGRGDRTTAGLSSSPGLVMGATGWAFRVGIASSALQGVAADSPWSFSKCITRPGFDTQLATRANPFNIEFFAWPYSLFTNTSGKDVPLWTRTLA